MSSSPCSPKALSDLGFLEVQRRFQGHCHSELGRKRVQSLLPTIHPLELESRRELFRQARQLMEVAERPDLAFPDLTELLAELRRSPTMIDSRDMLEVARSEIVTRNAGQLLKPAREHKTLELADLLEGLSNESALVSQIHKVLDPDGEVKDTASSRLNKIRSSINTQRGRVKTELLAFGRERGDALQEAMVMERAGRYVIPIKSGHRGQVPGLVHDFSSSRQTSFVEPTQFVEHNNHIQELLGEEREEVLRLLRELTLQIATAAPRIARNQEILAQLDALLASVALSQRQGADLATVSDGDVYLQTVRHPLLDPEACIPLDLKLQEDCGLLLISGPNGGGKTVALKTLGLLSLMHQAGMAIPSGPGSCLPLFQKIVVDIGDPQNLGSDSTFTGHLRTQKAMLQEAEPGWLVLLDELGSGTDPEEGAALATAVLEILNEQGARIVATTHLLRIKSYAHSCPWAVLAATELDPRTHQPTFRLVYGIPGRSSAIQIAENLGFPADCLTRARERLEVGQLEFEELIQELEAARLRLDEARDEARIAHEDATKLKDRYEQKKGKGYAEGLREFQKESSRLLMKLRELAQRSAGHISRSELRKAEQRAGVLASRAAQARSAPQAPKERGEPIEPGRLQAGERVFVVPLNISGTVLDVDSRGNQASIQGPSFVVTAEVRNLRRLQPLSAKQKADQERQVAIEVEIPDKIVPFQLDIRGTRVEEGVEQVEQYLSDAALAHMPSVRVVHGLGTGRLRKAIQEILKGHSLVAEFRDGGETEGGMGATIVTLQS